MTSDVTPLFEGYKRFRKKYFDGNNQLFEDLAKNGQSPEVLVIACSDSRVDPAIVLNCQPGDLFVVRNVANLVPPHEDDNGYHGTSAALEFAICGLGVKHIIIFGHSQCGGIRALLDPQNDLVPEKGYVKKWMSMAEDAKKYVSENHDHEEHDEKVHLCTQRALVQSLNNLKTFPWLREKLDTQDLSIHAWYFEISTGKIEAFDQEKQTFCELDI